MFYISCTELAKSWICGLDYFISSWKFLATLSWRSTNLHLISFQIFSNISLSFILLLSQLSSVAQLCLTLSDPMDCMPGFPVHHQLPGLTQGRPSLWCHPAILSSVILFSSCLQSFPASGSFLMSQFFTSGGQILEFQLQHQTFQWIFRTDFL